MKALFLSGLGSALFLARASSQTSSNLASINSQPGNGTSEDSASTNSTLQTTGSEPYSNAISSTKLASKTDSNNLTAVNYIATSNTTSPSNTAVTLTNPSGVNDTIPMHNTPPSNSSSKNWEVYAMSPDIEWKQGNFTVHDKNGTSCYVITNQCKDETLTKKEFVVEDANTEEKKVKIDAHVKLCGFGQKYEASDHLIFQLDTRAFLSDRWYILTNATTYVYHRAARSLDGAIVEDDHADHVVATVSTSSETKHLTLRSDGTLPAWDLIALLAVVRTRIHTCGY